MKYNLFEWEFEAKGGVFYWKHPEGGQEIRAVYHKTREQLDIKYTSEKGEVEEYMVNNFIPEKDFSIRLRVQEIITGEKGEW